MTIGTRGSQLALWQARTVARLIEEAGGPTCEIVIIRTTGDERATRPDLAGTFDKRSFVKEIEDALLNAQIDVAVHSGKDLPAVLPDGLTIGATLPREDPRDAILLPNGRSAGNLDALRAILGPQARIGTSSIRRAAMLRRVLPGATFVSVRGNVDTRFRKLDAGECDALVLAAAGVMRLGLASRLSVVLPIDLCVPAPGQGIVAIEMAAAASPEVRHAVRRIDDADTTTVLVAERATVHALGGGCHMPLGVLATLDGHELAMLGMVASPDGRRVIRASIRGNRGGAAAAGEKLARLLIARGAGDVLSSQDTK